MRAALLKELRCELAARREVRKAGIFPGPERRDGWQHAVLIVVAPAAVAAMLAMLWF